MRSIAMVLVFIAVIGLLVYTNPTIDDYAEYIREETLRESNAETDTGKQFVYALGGIAGHFFAGATQRSNYVLFSTYHTDIGVQRMDCIGVLGNFVRCEKTPQEAE